jgi:hypothetical protein
MPTKAVRRAARRGVLAAELAAAHPDLPALLHATMHDHHERLCTLEQSALSLKAAIDQLQQVFQFTQTDMIAKIGEVSRQAEFNRLFLFRAVDKIKSNQEDCRVALEAKADRELAQCTADIKELWVSLVQLSKDIQTPINAFREGELRYQEANRLLHEQVAVTREEMARMDKEFRMARSDIDAWQEATEAAAVTAQRLQFGHGVRDEHTPQASLEERIEAAQISVEDGVHLPERIRGTGLDAALVRQWSRNQRSHSRDSSVSSRSSLCHGS